MTTLDLLQALSNNVCAAYNVDPNNIFECLKLARQLDNSEATPYPRAISEKEYKSTDWKNLTKDEVVKKIFPHNLELEVHPEDGLFEDLYNDYGFDIRRMETKDEAQKLLGFVPDDGYQDSHTIDVGSKLSYIDTMDMQITYDLDCSYMLEITKEDSSTYRLRFRYSPNYLNEMYGAVK